jgi:hypothetical protein
MSMINVITTFEVMAAAAAVVIVLAIVLRVL